MLNMHPWLINHRCLSLHNYAVMANIGAHDFEKKNASRILISLRAYIPLSVSTPKKDSLIEVVDYDFIRDQIKNRISLGHIHLLETLCDDIARMILVHSMVFAVHIAIAKPDIYPECEMVYVEVLHTKDMR